MRNIAKVDKKHYEKGAAPHLAKKKKKEREKKRLRQHCCVVFVSMFSAMEEVWYWFKLLVICFMALVFVLKVVVLLWWRPRKIEHHFSKQGIRGPPYRFFIGNVKELVGLMLKASSQPMPFSHNILPRVLSFYHHWKKIYGISSSFLLSSSLPLSFQFLFTFFTTAVSSVCELV